MYVFLVALAASLSLLAGPVTVSTWREAVPFHGTIIEHFPPELAPEVDLLIRTWANDAIAVTTGQHYVAPDHTHPRL